MWDQFDKAEATWKDAATMYVPRTGHYPFQVWGVVLIPDRSIALRLWAYSGVPMRELCD